MSERLRYAESTVRFFPDQAVTLRKQLDTHLRDRVKRVDAAEP